MSDRDPLETLWGIMFGLSVGLLVAYLIRRKWLGRIFVREMEQATREAVGE